MPSLRIQVEDQERGTRESHVFHDSPVRIGRNEMNDLHVQSGYVSQWHAVIQFDERKIQYLDLGSTNGTLLNGDRMSGTAPEVIRKPDVLSIGPINLNLQFSDVAPEPVDDEPSGDATALDADAAQHLRTAQSAADKLQSGYDAYRNAWKECLRRIGIVFSRIDEGARPMTVSLLESRCPAIKNEAEYAQIKTQLNLAAEGIASVGELAEAIGAPDDDKFLKNVNGALKVFSASFVELRKGFDQFSSELAVRTFQSDSPLLQAEEGKEVLKYLLSEQAEKRTKELRNAYADMMIHQVALISGVMEGVKGLLRRIGPEAISEDLKNNPEKVMGLSVKNGFWPFSVTARWRRYSKMHHDFMEEGQEITSVLFGKDFARKYGATAGSDAPKEVEGAKAPKQLKAKPERTRPVGGRTGGSRPNRGRGANRRTKR